MWAVLIPSLGWAGSQPQAEKSIDQSRQLIVVTTESWSDNHGTLRLFERAGGLAWRPVPPEVPVMLGRNGLAWGIGLHEHAATKWEGDGRSPAGLFELERIYGRDAQLPNERFPYRQLNDSMEGIDDPRSRFYNRLVDSRFVKLRDWSHSEKVRRSNPMFRWCIEVKHNWQQRPAYGSCIYLHIWKAPDVPTSGCTAMSEAALTRIVSWLDARKRPLLIALPQAEFNHLRTAAWTDWPH